MRFYRTSSIVLLLLGSALFKYPDTINSKITLTGTTPVSSVLSKSTGKLQELYVENNQIVKESELLAVITNAAKTNDIIKLEHIIDEFNSDSIPLVKISTTQLQLGELQSLYSSFCIILSEYRQFKSLDYYPKKIELLKNRAIQNQIYYKNMTDQRDIIIKQNELSTKQYLRDSILGKNGVISLEDVENSRNKFLQSELSVENIERSLENLQIQLSQMNEALYDLKYQYFSSKYNLESQLSSIINQLKTGIDSWKINYALISPVNGKISFSQYWTENQNISTGNIVFNIVPLMQGEIIGKAKLPSARSGKVKVGQQVNIKFPNFPANEFGIIKGYVKNISLIPSVNNDGIKEYTLDISLLNGLLTSYKKELPFIPEMEGDADIITNDISLLERLLSPLKLILTDNF